MRYRQRRDLAGWVLAAAVLGGLTVLSAELRPARALSPALWCPPPEITQQPQSATACVGGTVTFTVLAEGDPPLEYQWYKDGVPIILADEPTYTIEDLVPAHAGSYSVEVRNPCGSVRSEPAVLTVIDEPPMILEDPQDQVVCTGAGEVAFGVVAGGDEPLSFQWRHEGRDIPGATDPTLILTDIDPNDAGSYDVVVANPCDPNGIASAPAILTVLTAPPEITGAPQDQAVCPGEAVSFSVTAEPPEGLSYQWRHNGVELPGATGDTLTIDPVEPNDGGSYDVIVSNPCGPTTSTAATLTVLSAPAISQQPSSMAVCEGQPASFTVTAVGDPPPQYQWRKDGVELPGQNDATLTIDTVEPNDVGVYDVLVFNVCGQVLSEGATLEIKLLPTIVEQPQGGHVCEQGSVSFSVTAAGQEPLSYQWRREGVEIPGATASTYTIAALELDDAGSYDVVVSNECGQVVSEPAALTIEPLPRIVAQPQPGIIARGQSYEFCVTASGADLSYQWQQDGVDIVGATGRCYATGAAGSYRCVVSNPCGSVTTREAELEIASLVSVDASAAPPAIRVGGNSTLTATASGGLPPYAYEWSTGQSGASIVVTPAQNAAYSVTATDSLGQVATGSVAVTVAEPLTVAVRASAFQIAPGQASTLTALVWGGLRPFGYEWSTGDTAPSITVTPTETTTYSVTVSDPLGQRGTASVTVAVEEPEAPVASPPVEEEPEPEQPGQEEQTPPADGASPEPDQPEEQMQQTQPEQPSGLCPAVALIGLGLTLVGLWRTREPRRRS